MIASRRITVLALALACAGCVGATEVCTLIGCSGALTIQFTSPPAEPYHIEGLSVEAGRIDFDCPDPSKCQTAQLRYTPDKLVLTVTTAHGSAEYNLAPRYTPVYANGKRCGVTCRNGTVTVGFP